MKLLKFIIDENISPIIVTELKKLNYDVVHVREICKGCPDNEIIKLAKKENRIVTLDKDFGELFSEDITIILIRIKDQSPKSILETLIKFLKQNEGLLETKEKKLIVIRKKA
ncbi:MAG TPA: DUF5615 family PIN-like protein [Caldisericia bacterium]|nr:DUF5615 family PIN-like protein [Caldisericia bacterium]